MKRLEEELDQIARQARTEQQRPATPASTQNVVVRRQEVTRKKDEVQRDMAREAALVQDHPTEPLPASALKVGAVVWVSGLNAEAKVVEVAGDGRRATVQVGLLKSKVKLADLRVPRPKAPGKTQAPAQRPSKHAAARHEPTPSVSEYSGSPGEPTDLRFMRSETNTADVRGMRVDEALTRVEELLDRAYVEHHDTVMIIHGMGTSALRKAIREYLKSSRYSKSFRGGQQDEGADGVTIVEIG
jgi:DNA mismatch repair protein MutS2